jgi:hypothetical protein
MIIACIGGKGIATLGKLCGQNLQGYEHEFATNWHKNWHKIENGNCCTKIKPL